MRGLLAGGLFCLSAWAVGMVTAHGSDKAAAPKPDASSSSSSPMTLEQAVAKVQSQTHGKVLRAGSRQYGNATEYLIKVLTPDGHVRVVPVRSQPVRPSENTPEETR